MPDTWPPSPPANSRNQQPKREPRMMLFNNGRKAQGGALPVITRHGTIHPAGGLDTHRQGWRIRHPQAATYKGQSATLPPFLATCRGSIHIWGHGSGAKENAPTAPLSFVALSCGYPIRLCTELQRTLPMIYTFCITRSRGPIAALSAIRTVSVYATNEAQARTHLAGLPLVFLSRCPASIAGGQHHG